MKQFSRIEPTTQQVCGLQYKRTMVVKTFKADDDSVHEFTTWGKEGGRNGGVIALTPDRKVIVTYQFRAGPERWMWEIPGGKFNGGEDEQAAALRELKEETGYEPQHVTLLGKSCRDAYCNMTWYYFLATGCTLSDDGPELDKEERDQGAEARLISIKELIDNAKHDRMTDPEAVLMAYEQLNELAAA